MEYDKFLPIGTIVKVKNAQKRAMITGFCVVNENDLKKIYDYSACMYPEGMLSSKQTILVNHEDIEEVIYLGLIDEEEKQFKNKLNKQLSNMK